jgi:predicted nucleic-acid-binding protein
MERALAACRQGRGDFADYVIRGQALAAGASGVVTFDRVLKGESDFQLPGA